MEKIFFADKSAFTTEAALKKIFSAYFGKDCVEILRTKHGKPYVENAPFFSVTHTQNRLYIAFSNEEIGIDAETLTRTPYYESIIKKFPLMEQEEISNTDDFLHHWVAKESAVKYLGGTIAQDLHKLCFAKGALTYENKVFPAKITFLQHENFILAVCGNGNFKNTPFIPLETL